MFEKEIVLVTAKNVQEGLVREASCLFLSWEKVAECFSLFHFARTTEKLSHLLIHPQKTLIETPYPVVVSVESSVHGPRGQVSFGHRFVLGVSGHFAAVHEPPCAA